MAGTAQVNSGSDGHDGAFNPTQSITIDMADHPDGIYHYTSVNIPNGVTVSFTPNAKNTPVVWLVQGDCVINSGGRILISGRTGDTGLGGSGGPGGFSGGSGGTNPMAGQGPGGGAPNDVGGNASFGSVGQLFSSGPSYGGVGSAYGNIYLLPLVGGSGGGGSRLHPHGDTGGGGGGGAILIAANNRIVLNGSFESTGGNGYDSGGGTGGSIRLVSPKLSGTGGIFCNPGKLLVLWNPNTGGADGPLAGQGRIRFDVLENNFGGSIIGGVYTQGFQPIILPAPNQGIQLNIASIGGVAVGGSPGGVMVNPDVTIPAQQSNPLNVVVNCTNVPLNTDIIVKVHPANGPDVTATAKNTAGTLATSTATVPVAMPHGGGIIYASAVTGIAGAQSATDAKDARIRDIAKTGWTANGETFVAMELTASVGGKQRVSYLSNSGKRYEVN